MTQLEKLLAAIRNNPKGVKFHDAAKVAEHYFGPPRVRGSHNVYTMPWASFPRVNLQNVGGYVESYQATQLLAAIDKIEAECAAAAKGTNGTNGAEDEHDDKQA